MNGLTLEQHKELNDAVDTYTGWSDWKAMREFLIEHPHYIPTISANGSNKKRNKAMKAIQQHLERLGIPYFNGSKVVG